MSMHAVRYTAPCRNCGHEIDQPMPGAEFENVHGIHVRCGECDTANWATKD